MLFTNARNGPLFNFTHFFFLSFSLSQYALPNSLVELRCASRYEREIESALKARDELGSRLSTAHDSLYKKEMDLLEREREREEEVQAERMTARVSVGAGMGNVYFYIVSCT
jgi:hypothetical protein